MQLFHGQGCLDSALYLVKNNALFHNRQFVKCLYLVIIVLVLFEKSLISIWYKRFICTYFRPSTSMSPILNFNVSVTFSAKYNCNISKFNLVIPLYLVKVIYSFRIYYESNRSIFFLDTRYTSIQEMRENIRNWYLVSELGNLDWVYVLYRCTRILSNNRTVSGISPLDISQSDVNNRLNWYQRN